MANNFRISNATAVRLADSFDDEINKGDAAAVIDTRTGSQPADPDTTASGTLLATNAMSDPAFGSAADGDPGGVLTADTISDDTSADDTGTAGYFRMRATGTGADDVADGECGTSGADMNFNTTAITSGSTVSITSFVVTMPEA